MLVRAARRKALPQALQGRASYEQLQLPWLCPSYNTIFSKQRRWTSIDGGRQEPGLRRQRNSKDASYLPSRRSLATSIDYRLADTIPFEGISNVSPAPPSSSKYQEDEGYFPFGRISDLRPFDPTSPLALGESLTMPARSYRVRMPGIGGELSEMSSLFHACLQVGRIERAGTILLRLSEIPDIDTGELLLKHNEYLCASIEKIRMNPSQNAVQELHKWYELHIRLADLPQTAETISYMVKASLRSPRNRRDRLIHRYMDMLDEETALQMLNPASELLTAHEINQVTTIYPKYNYGYNLMEELESFEGTEGEAGEGSDLPIEGSSLLGTPMVRPTKQKGLGLKSLKQTLSIFSHLPDEGLDLSGASQEAKLELQTRLEEDAVQSAVDRWRFESEHLNKMGLNTNLQTKSVGARMWKWQTDLTAYLNEELKRVDEAESGADTNYSTVHDRCQYGPFLRLLPMEKVAALTILTCMGSLAQLGVDKGIPLAGTIMDIANSLEDEAAVTYWSKQKKKNPVSGVVRRDPLKKAKLETLKKTVRSRRPGTAAKIINEELFKVGVGQELRTTSWPMAAKAKLGSFLVSALIETAQVPVTLVNDTTDQTMHQMQPAFSHSLQYKRGKKYGVVTANTVLVEQFKREPVHSLLAKQLPMIVEPQAWSLFNKGGYLAHPSKVMRIKSGDQTQRNYIEAAISQGDMVQTFKGLDVLGKTPWTINQAVFDVMLEAWNSGEEIANVPAENPILPIPQEPDVASGPDERKKWVKAIKAMENERSGLHSQRCFQNFQLEIARALRNSVFYFPHNVDFRGRAYPIPPYLNHMGADHCRGLLKFGKGKPLGEKGLRWLKIHLSNVFGYDKASLTEREQFTERNIDKIYDSVKKPLAGDRWWLEAEDPWQCLATCFELTSALDSPDPTQFISSLPVHQDGTCNGLQHYAALGGDAMGAQQVNLVPGDRPADVYTAVANMVKEAIAEDRTNGDALAEALDGKITRKTVKQTVMTNVYGVTYNGAVAQVRRQLEAANFQPPSDINMSQASAYIARKTFNALSHMFRGAHDIQFWLAACASRISTSITPEQLTRLEAEWPRLIGKEKWPRRKGYIPPTIEQLIQFKSSVVWTTPLCMPVVQPYRSSEPTKVSTALQRVFLSEPHGSDPVDKRKQVQAFPPNFIHSLDATHMLLSALKCDELGLSFAAVHDSFWTHACDVETMGGVLRDSFVRIHGENVIGRLASEFNARYKDSLCATKIHSGSHLWSRVWAWRKEREQTREFRKSTKKGSNYYEELLLEHQRLSLLRSSNPADVEKGKQLVTPGSMFEEMATSNHASPKEVVGMQSWPSGLGDVSPANVKEIENFESEDAHDSMKADDSIFGEDSIDLAASESEASGDSNETEGSGFTQREWVEIDKPNAFERSITGAPKQRLKSSAITEIWVPLTFPPLPKRGIFDIGLLKNSKYFFS